jgi:hypothetical protein
VPIVVIGGSGKDVGKTALVCAVISALREFDWTAVKITGHDYGPVEEDRPLTRAVIREETSAGEDTDTGRYLAAGARRALLVTRFEAVVAVEEIRAALGEDRNVIFESNRIVDVLKADVCVALVGGQERKPSFERLLRLADAALIVGGAASADLPAVPRFEIESSVDRLPAEFVNWLRERLGAARQ